MEKHIEFVVNLMNDIMANKVGVYAEKGMDKYSDEAVRDAIFDILGERKLTWAGWRNHHNEIFTISEVVLNTNLPNAWETSPFYNTFVDVHNGVLGGKNEFVVEDEGTLISAVTVSGNHWDIDRKKVPGRKAFSLDTEWIAIRLYDDFERFLKGYITVPELIQKMQKAMNNAIDSRIFTAFNSAGTYLPSDFTKTGTYNRDSMMELIEKVETATQRSVTLAGTRTALASIVNGMSADIISNSQKEEIATSGLVLMHTGLGAPAIQIPQTFVRGTFDFAVNNNAIYVLPDNEKFIKVYFEGDTRARELSPQDTHDMTLDTQIQTKVGVGCVFSNVFGKYILD